MLKGERALPKIIFIILGSILIVYCLKFISIQHSINNNIYKINDHETKINKRISDIIIYANVYKQLQLPDISMKNGQYAEDYIEYDLSTADEGYIVIKPLKDNIACVIDVDGKSYSYLKLPKKKIVIPLAINSNNYRISLAKPYKDRHQYIIYSSPINNTYTEDIFVMPNYVVNFSLNSSYRNMAISLKGANDEETILNVYKWVRENIEYDTEKKEKIQQNDTGFCDYIPNLDKIYNEKKGVCLDKAALATAFLRIDGIPAKLVFGDLNEEYHAWVEVMYEGNIIIVDPTVNFMGASKDYKQKLIF